MENKPTNRNVVIQKLKRGFEENSLLAVKYYGLLAELNDAGLTKREVELVAHTAICGNIALPSHREEFCKRYDTANTTVNNMLSRLRKIGWLVKKGRVISVHPAISLNFENDVVLEIKLLHG